MYHLPLNTAVFRVFTRVGNKKILSFFFTGHESFIYSGTDCTAASSPRRTSTASLVFKSNHGSCLGLVMKPVCPSCSLHQGVIWSNPTRKRNQKAGRALMQTCCGKWTLHCTSQRFFFPFLCYTYPSKCQPRCLRLPGSSSPTLMSDTMDVKHHSWERSAG